MKNPLPRLIPLSLLIASLLALVPIPAYAAPTVNSITPGTIVNDVVNVITVSGIEFDNTAAVLMDGGALPTNFLNAQTLTAVVPAGVSAGDHAITVSMSNVSVGGKATLTVLTPTPVPPPTATTAPDHFVRPQFVLESTKINGTVTTNSQFKLSVKIGNAGTAPAYSVQAVFSSADLAPLKNGGIIAVGSVGAGDSESITQQFMVTGNTYGVALISLDVTLNYYDAAGTAYSDKFTVSLPTSYGSGSGTVYATATPTAIKSSQLVITSYAISLDPLQPGETFTLTMTVQNTGNATAKSVTMIVGGGSSGTSSSGTPEPGGVSGGSGEFSNFAPVGTSNVQTLGDLGPNSAIQAKQNLIVNTSTAPGAYPLKITFSYVNNDNEPINDDQVITLLVYSLPNVNVSFYRPLDPFFVGQPGALPIQVVNIGKRAVVLGNITVTSETGTVENGTGLVGSIDTGGYYTMDAMFSPEKSGKVTLNVTIDYTDDFNAPRTITSTLEVDVQEGMPDAPVTDPSMGGGGGGGGGGDMPIVTTETPMQKVWRFVLGLFGLDSAAPSSGEQVPSGTEVPAVPIKPGGGGKG
jgi:hypothetical protein